MDLLDLDGALDESTALDGRRVMLYDAVMKYAGRIQQRLSDKAETALTLHRAVGEVLHHL